MIYSCFDRESCLASLKNSRDSASNGTQSSTHVVYDIIDNPPAPAIDYGH